MYRFPLFSIRFVSNVAVALALSSSVEAAPPPTPAMPQEVASARAVADAAIAQAKAEGIFENSSEGKIPQVTHQQSGFSCRLDQTSTSKIVVLDAPGPRGEAFECDNVFLTRTPERFIVRHMPGVGLGEASDSAVKAFLAEHADAKPYTGPMISLSFKTEDPLKDSKTARFVYLGTNGAEFVRLGLIVVDGWVIEHRATGKPDDAPEVELYSNVAFGAAVTGMCREPPVGKP